jgi:hypothetical protein
MLFFCAQKGCYSGVSFKGLKKKTSEEGEEEIVETSEEIVDHIAQLALLGEASYDQYFPDQESEQAVESSFRIGSDMDWRVMI